jgi:hypothetical protein
MKTLSQKKTWPILVTIWLSSLLLGCTVIPKTAKDNRASFDGTAQNSGFYGYDVEGYGYITPHARDRYNLLIANFGYRYQPPMKFDEGITATATNSYRIDPEHLVDFQEMNGWKKSLPPK